MCSSKPPKADPAIGQAALQNADIARQQLELAKDQLAYNKEESAWQTPLIQKIAQQQIDTADTNNQRSDEQWQLYKSLFQPVEAKMVNDSMNFDSPERQAQLAAQAGADVTKSYQGAQDQNQRNMERMGVNPNSGKFQAINSEAGLAQAADTAGAMNTARNNAITQGMALRQGAAQFGRNMPNTGLAADSTALNAGNSAVGNIAQGNNINNANAATAQNWFGGAMNGNNSAAGILNNQYQNQLNAWAQQQNNTANMIGGMGSLVGSIGGAAIMSKLKSGGVIKNNKAYGLSSGYPRFSDYGLRRKGYAEGGIIKEGGHGSYFGPIRTDYQDKSEGGVYRDGKRTGGHGYSYESGDAKTDLRQNFLDRMKSKLKGQGYAEGGVLKLNDAEEQEFQEGIRQTPWFSEFKKQYGEEPNLNDPDYDYRAAWKNGVRPELDPYDGTYHWSSGYKDASGNDVYLKSERHPTMWMQKFFERTGGKDPREFGIKTPEEAEVFLAAKGYAKGGVIRNSYGLSSLRRRGYTEGGMIEGPGTTTSDSIPATIEGQTPIRVSNGEAVLNAEAVQLVGEPFIHNINAAGLMMLSRKKPAQAVTGPVNSLAGLSNRRGQ